MIKLKKLPIYLLLIVYLFQATIFIVNYLGFYNSYVISFNSYSLKGFFIFNLFYIFFIVCLLFTARINVFTNIKFKLDHNRIKRIIRLLTLLGTVFLVLSISNTIGIYSLKRMIVLGNSGQLGVW
jgi:hypothetical protein